MFNIITANYFIELKAWPLIPWVKLHVTNVTQIIFKFLAAR